MQLPYPNKQHHSEFKNAVRRASNNNGKSVEEVVGLEDNSRSKAAGGSMDKIIKHEGKWENYTSPERAEHNY
jgi:hypothetical protein